MPKLIEYPRTGYTGAWELTEIIDETGGKSSIENAAKKMNRRVSGSFKAIIGSAVKFGLITSKRELLSTTTLFKRIKHAYDKEEEMQFHREAFLTPPLFAQLCRKFRNRELPVQMLDVMLMREFNVEEINAQGVAKVFVDGCRMCAILNDENIIVDIDRLLNSNSPKRTLASANPLINTFQPTNTDSENLLNSKTTTIPSDQEAANNKDPLNLFGMENFAQKTVASENQVAKPDAVASLFNLSNESVQSETTLPNLLLVNQPEVVVSRSKSTPLVEMSRVMDAHNRNIPVSAPITGLIYQLSVTGPGINTSLDLSEEADVEIALALLEKVRRRFRKD